MKYTCYCLTRNHAPLERCEAEVPTPKGDEVLVRMTAAGVCHSDIHIWEGEYDIGGGKKMNLRDRGIKLPLTMGHEIAGEVVAVGPDVKDTAIGKSVVVYPWIGCGKCPTCLRDEENYCLNTRSMGVFQEGGYAQYVLVPRSKYCVDMGGLDPAQTAPLACSGVTTYSAIKKFGPAIKDEAVVIMGAGGLGHMAIAMLKAMDAKGAIVVDIDPAKRTAALEAGALQAIDGTAPDAAQQILNATGGGARMVLDLVGAPATVNLGLAVATKGTDIVIVGLFGGEVTVPIPYLPLRPIGLRGSYVGNLKELRELVALALAGKLKPVKVTRRPLDEANDALMSLKDGKVVGRVVLVP